MASLLLSRTWHGNRYHMVDPAQTEVKEHWQDTCNVRREKWRISHPQAEMPDVEYDCTSRWKPDQVEDKRGADIAWRSGVQLLVDRRNADSGESPAY